MQLTYRTGNNFQIKLTLDDFPALKTAGFSFATANYQSHMTGAQTKYIPKPWEDVVVAFRALPKTDAALRASTITEVEAQAAGMLLASEMKEAVKP